MPLHGDGVVCVEVSAVFIGGNNTEGMRRSLSSSSPKHMILHESLNFCLISSTQNEGNKTCLPHDDFSYTCYVPGTVLKTSYARSYLKLKTDLQDSYYCGFHFTDEEPETKKNCILCL